MALRRGFGRRHPSRPCDSVSSCRGFPYSGSESAFGTAPISLQSSPRARSGTVVNHERKVVRIERVEFEPDRAIQCSGHQLRCFKVRWQYGGVLLPPSWLVRERLPSGHTASGPRIAWMKPGPVARPEQMRGPAALLRSDRTCTVERQAKCVADVFFCLFPFCVSCRRGWLP